nr:MAG TPA: hypothetical protein [Caudoviricetes sp.]
MAPDSGAFFYLKKHKNICRKPLTLYNYFCIIYV